MKLYGMAGKGTGRVGSMVYAVRKGEQIVREYNPNVTNPNTRLQVVQRAKFKLLSQLTAAIGNNGLFFDNVPAGRSMRNEFTRRNMSLVSVAAGSDVATVDVSALSLTSGAFPAPSCDVEPNTGVCQIELPNPVFADVVGAVVVVLTQPQVGKVLGRSIRKMRTEGEEGMEVNIMVPPALYNRTTVLVWVYKFRDDAARARYEQALMNNAAVSVAFERAVAAGDIIPSVTTVAPFLQGRQNAKEYNGKTK